MISKPLVAAFLAAGCVGAAAIVFGNDCIVDRDSTTGESHAATNLTAGVVVIRVVLRDRDIRKCRVAAGDSDTTASGIGPIARDRVVGQVESSGSSGSRVLQE